MKKLLAFLLSTALIVITSCSGGDDEKATFNKTRATELITAYDSNGGSLAPEQYSELITNTRLLFDEIKGQMKALIDITEPLRFTQEYQKLKHNEDFMDKLVMREKVWRVLVLGQKGFSDGNRTEFGNLPDECMIIDYYDDCIRARVTEAETGNGI